MANPTEQDISALAREVVAELDPGTRIEDKIILSKRQLLAIAGGGLTAGALAQFGVSEAEAQSAAGAVGTSTDPVDVEGFDVTAANSFTDPAGTSHSGGLADSPHDNAAHSTNYADQNHGNAAHSATFLDDTDITSTSTTSGYELDINGDTYQFNE